MKSFTEYQEQRVSEELAEELAERLVAYGIDPDEFCDNALEIFAACNESELYNELMSGLRNLAQSAAQGVGNMARGAAQGVGNMARGVAQQYQQGEQSGQLKRAQTAIQKLQQQLKGMGYQNPQIDQAFGMLGTQLQQAASYIQSDPNARLGSAADGQGAFGRHNQTTGPMTAAPVGGGGGGSNSSFGAGVFS